MSDNTISSERPGQPTVSDKEAQDAISEFYIVFGIILLVPHSIYVILSNNPSSLGWFAYHPPLLTLAFAALAYGISVLQPASRPDTAAKMLEAHQLYVGAVALPLLLAAVSVEYQQKENQLKAHFTSWHGLVGLVAAFGMILQAIFGSLVNGGVISRKYTRLHRRAGYGILTLITIAISLGGICSNFLNAKAWTATRYLCYGLGPFSILGGVLSRTRCSKL